MKTAPRKFRAKFYVRFYYKPGSTQAKYWGTGPFYAAFDEKEKALEHLEWLRDSLDDAHKVEVLSRYRLNNEKEI